MVGFPTPFSQQAGQKASRLEGHCAQRPLEGLCHQRSGYACHSRCTECELSLSFLRPTHSLPPSSLIGS